MASDAKAISSKPEYSVAIHNLVLKRKAGKEYMFPGVKEAQEEISFGNVIVTIFWDAKRYCIGHFAMGVYNNRQVPCKFTWPTENRSP